LGFLPYTRWEGALIESAIQVALLFWVAYLLHREPDPKSGIVTIALALLMFGGYSYWKGLYPGLGKGIASFVFYGVFVGFGEEILYRGYILTRLNEAFGRPWRFRGVGWGWGTVLAALFFGLTHALNRVELGDGRVGFTWAWGMWTFFGGLVFSYLREKTGSIVAPAVVHGLPQALAYLLVRSF
jgi:membrane protease YdiL (CAAX protease family)